MPSLGSNYLVTSTTTITAIVKSKGIIKLHLSFVSQNTYLSMEIKKISLGMHYVNVFFFIIQVPLNVI